MKQEKPLQQHIDMWWALCPAFLRSQLIDNDRCEHVFRCGIGVIGQEPLKNSSTDVPVVIDEKCHEVTFGDCTWYSPDRQCCCRAYFIVVVLHKPIHNQGRDNTVW